MSIKLSICIPTYNRDAFLSETIQSVVSQATDEIELVISDNASTDNTQEIVARFQKQFPLIRYSRHNINQGIDRNALRVVEMATGEFCWFLGSDDQLEPEAIPKILELLKKYPNLGGACVGFTPYNQNLQEPGLPWNPARGKCREVTSLEDVNTCFNILGYYFGFFSGQVFRREVWMKVFHTRKWEGFCNGFVHAYMQGRVLKETGRWLVVPDSCVRWRGQRDELLASIGCYERLRFDIEGYGQVLEALLGKKHPSFISITRTGIAISISAMVLEARLHKIDFQTVMLITRLCFRHYHGYLVFWTNVLPILITPIFILRLLKPALKMYKKIFW